MFLLLSNIAAAYKNATTRLKNSSDTFLKLFFNRSFLLYLLTANSVLLSSFSGAHAATTGVWQPNANGGSANAGGVTVTMSTSLLTATPSAGTLNSGGSANFWTNPYGSSVAGAPALSYVLAPGGVNGTVTVTFSQPVNNPVIHFARLGGTALGVFPQRLFGPPQARRSLF